MGNNRMVVNRDGTVEQKTHYYPYGPRRHRESIFMLSARRRGFSRGKVIGDISTNESLQKYKFEGKELDRTFGLDTYDVHARQYFAMAPMWDRADMLAGDYPDTSPYVYCGGDPVNRGDYNGMDWVSRTVDGVEEIYFDPDIIGYESCWRYNEANGTSLTYIWDGTTRKFDGKEYTFSNENKKVECDGGWDEDGILDFGDAIIFGYSNKATDARTLHNNMFTTSYTGTDNPKSYRDNKDTYDYRPRNLSEYPSRNHDQRYDAAESTGMWDCSVDVCRADLLLAAENIALIVFVPTSMQPVTDKLRSAGAAILFGTLGALKLPVGYIERARQASKLPR